MNNTAILGTSVKDYAKSRGKTIQAVYQQMKRKENSAALEGHVSLHRVGNKNVKFLDDEAIAILDKSSSSAPLVVLEDGLRAELEEAKLKVAQLEKQLFYQEGKNDALRDMLKEKEQQLLLLAEPQNKIDTLEAQIDDLSAELEKQCHDLAQAEKERQEASEKLTAFESMSRREFAKFKRQQRKEERLLKKQAKSDKTDKE